MKKPIEQDEFALPEWLHSQEETHTIFDISEKLILTENRQGGGRHDEDLSLKSYKTNNNNYKVLLLDASEKMKKTHDINHNNYLLQQLTYYSYNNYVIIFGHDEEMMVIYRIRMVEYLKPKLAVSNTVIVLLLIGIFLE